MLTRCAHARPSQAVRSRWHWNLAICHTVVIFLLATTPVCAQPVPWADQQRVPPRSTRHATAEDASGQEPADPKLFADPGCRLIIRLRDAPLVHAMPSVKRPGNPQLSTPDERAYLGSLQQVHAQVGAAVQNALPDAVVEQSYQFAFNGLAIRLPACSATARDALRQLPGVAGVYEEAAFEPTLYASLPAIGAPALWSQLGGASQAGAGVKIAILDSGIDYSASHVRWKHILLSSGLPCG